MKRLVIRLVNVLDHLLPKREKVVLRGYPDVEDQCLAVLIALARRGYRGRVIWLMREEPAAVRRLAERHGFHGLALEGCRASHPRAVWHFLTARWVFFTHGTYSQGDWGNYEPPRSKTVVNLWHGMPIKTIWRLLPRPVEPPRAHVLLATSERFRRILMDASGMDADRVWVCGLPRNDLLQGGSPPAEEAIRELVGGDRWFLYLPTYRKSREGFLTEDGSEQESILAMSAQEMARLDEWLGQTGIALVVKAHPMSVHAVGEPCRRITNRIVAITDAWLADRQATLYGMAASSAALITDLSSIAVDYLLLDKPVFIYFPDLQEYLRTRGTVFENLEENLPGAIWGNVADLVEQMDQVVRRGADPWAARRGQLRADWHAVAAGAATDRLLDRLGIG
jgi:CDP-glycerol glycerophosphotransferase (TagB/SpsB family)